MERGHFVPFLSLALQELLKKRCFEMHPFPSACRWARGAGMLLEAAPPPLSLKLLFEAATHPLPILCLQGALPCPTPKLMSRTSSLHCPALAARPAFPLSVFGRWARPAGTGRGWPGCSILICFQRVEEPVSSGTEEKVGGLEGRARLKSFTL